MEIIPAVGEAEKLETELLVLGVFSGGPLTGSLRAVNDRSNGRLGLLLDRGALAEPAGATLMIGPLPGVPALRILLVSLGRAQTFSDRAYRQALFATAAALSATSVARAIVTLPENEVPLSTLARRVQQAGQILSEGSFAFDLPGACEPARVADVTLLLPQTLTLELIAALQQGVAIGEGVSFAKELGNLPPQICTPDLVARTAQEMAREFGFSLRVLGQSDFETFRMTSLLALERRRPGSCKLIVMQSAPLGARERPIVLVGTGIAPTARPWPGEQPLRRDPISNMRGAGSVLGTMRTVARLGLPLPIVGLIVASDGPAPGRREAQERGLPGASRSANHDRAEPSPLGDVLSHAARFSPACVIDVATLTRACVTALGSHASGLFVNDEALATELLKCGGVSGDRVWQLPIWDDDPPLARERDDDEADATDRPAGAIEAASGLARFATSYSWAHLDISGTASTAGGHSSATGRPVPLLAEFLIGRAKAAHGRSAFPLTPRTELHS